MPIYALDDATPEIAQECWIAPDAVLIGKVRVLKGASIWFGAVLRGDNEWITIGPNSNIQDHSIIHADPGQPVTIGRGVTIGHRVIVHSAHVGDDSLIGMGSILLNRARIGARSLVGAGALVTEDKSFEDGKMILGAPARAVRDLSAEQTAGLERSAAIYVANARRYAKGLRRQD
ncbi:MAG TPA: gamma carbonic anhydrase family protein [Rhizomicrobium sp.]|nr:gamma carbonic anhydrase family protein [Rhizomicrobium sp.]